MDPVTLGLLQGLSTKLTKKFDPTQYKGYWNKDAAYALGDVVQDLNTGKYWQANTAAPVGNGTGPTTPSYVGTWKQERLTTTANTSYTVTVPAGAVQVGDFMVAGYTTGTTGGNDQPQPVAGWSWLRSDLGTGSTNYHWYTRIATAADVSSGNTFSVSNVNNAFSAVVQAFRNVSAYSHGGAYGVANTVSLTGAWASGIVIPSASHLEAVVGFFGSKTSAGTYSSVPSGTGLTSGSNVLPSPLPASGSSSAGQYVFGWNTVTTSTTPLTLSVTSSVNVYVGALALALTAYQTPSGTYWTEVPGVGAALDTLIPAPTFIPSLKVPAEISLRQTITASGMVDKTGFPEWVYVVGVGGGGGGAAAAGGGAAACIQGWMKSSSIIDAIIGAGGSSGQQGNATIIGSLRAGGGGGGASSTSPDVNDMANALTVEPGAGHGGINPTAVAAPSTAGFQFGRDNLAFGMFLGGKSGYSTSGVTYRATSGAGGLNNKSGMAGDAGPGGGSGTGNSLSGGNATSPSLGVLGGGISITGAGGGGAGILAIGAPGVSTTGGAGGLGGGGGGAGTTGGAGGNGAVLIFY